MHLDIEFLRRLAAARYFCLGGEAFTALVVLIVAAVCPDRGSRFFRSIEFRLLRVSGRPVLSAGLLFLLVFGGRMALLPVLPVPHPLIHDEFSYLLAADTYSSGRLTNKPHPFWASFESVHILQQPTYMSMYPPLQGLFLALGQWISGFAWTGVCISVASMVLAIFWMLRGWFSPGWSLAGALLVAVRWGIFSYWMNSYWGGAGPALAGALVLGSLPRLLRAGRLRDAVALGLGLSCLANSRPYEGLILSSTAILTFAFWAFRRGLLHRLLRLRVVVPISLLLLCSATSMLFYNWRVTGKSLELPYISDRKQYATAPLLLVQTLKPEPVYRDQALRQVYTYEAELYRKARSLNEVRRKLKEFWLFFFGPLLSIPMVALFPGSHTRKDQRRAFFFLIIGVILAGLLMEVWFYPHYASPGMAAIAALIVQGLRGVRRWQWRGKPAGIFLTRAIPLACLLLAIVPLGAASLGLRLQPWPLQWYGGTHEPFRSARVFASLGKDGHRDLVFVRYNGAYSATDGEFVYNSADIDHSPVVWARDKGPYTNARLVRYLPGRRVWLFEPDQRPWHLRPYNPVPGGLASPPGH